MRNCLLVMALVACGGGGGQRPSPDSQPPADGPDLDPDGSEIPVDAFEGVCNPISQVGCPANQKCTWIWDQVTPVEVGHVGCSLLAGTEVAAGTACTDGRSNPDGPGADNCQLGSFCSANVCKTICDHLSANAASGCNAASQSCSRYNGLFETGGTTIAGLCDPTCDALDQNAGPAAACGSTDPANPNLGCYGQEQFSRWACAPVVGPTGTDRQPPFTQNGQFFVNSCAAGYVVLLTSASGSMTPICSGLCAAGNISNDPAEVGNDTGRDLASAKLHDAPAPAIGAGLCEAGKKGSSAGGPQNCSFLWPFTVNGAEVGIAPEYLDTLGFCFSFTQYQFDSNEDGISDANFPDCKTLPKRSIATPGNSDDAADFGCQKLAESMFAGAVAKPPVLRDLRVGFGTTKVIAPHRIVRE